MNAAPASASKAPAQNLDALVSQAKERLDKHTRETVEWHFNPETGSPFWLEKAKTLNFDPRKEVRCVRRSHEVPAVRGRMAPRRPGPPLGPQGLADKPIYVFETGGTTGIPKSRVVIEDHWIDYELFSDTLPDEYFPKGSNWMMLGPSGPRRLRLAVEHLAHYRGGICFCVDLDPRWVVKLIKNGDMERLKAYADHVHRPGDDHPVGRPRHQLHVHHAQAARSAGPAADERRLERRRGGHHRHLRRRHRVHAAVVPLLPRGAAGPERLHDADLRQHADGPGLRQAGRPGRQLQDHLLRPRAAGRDRGRRLRRSRRRSSTTATRAA